MDRHFLIAVSGQKSAASGIRFVADFFSEKSHIKATLFYSAPKAPALWENERNIEAVSKQKDQQRKLLAKGKDALENAKRICVEKGFSKENVIEKLQSQIFSKAADIIQEGEKGLYDAVILGRRGLSMLEEAFEDSVSRTIYKERFTFPLWLCRSSNPSRKNVLLYVDGSAASLQMTDHVGFILGQEKQHRVDMLSLESISSQSSLMNKYREALQRNGLNEDRIRTITPLSGNPGKQILKVLEKETYAAVALGRSSSESNLLTRLFKGPVCSILFKELTDAALWLCP